MKLLKPSPCAASHRMAAPDSPWISGGWRPAFNQKYQDLWAHGQKHPGLRGTSEYRLVDLKARLCEADVAMRSWSSEAGGAFPPHPVGFNVCNR